MCEWKSFSHRVRQQWRR